MEIFISVIIPTHNRANFLLNSINSVLEQEYKNFEIIIVDDFSTDNTEQIIQKTYNSNQVLYYKLEKNVGPAQARRFGVNKSKGDYIAFLDSDDLWLPNKLSLQVEYIKSYNCDALASQLYDLNITTKEKIVRGKFSENMRLFSQILSETCSIPMSTILLRRTCFFEYDIFSEIKSNYFKNNKILFFGDHFELLLKISLVENNFKFINQPLAIYTLHEKNVSISFNSYFAHIYQIYSSLKYFDIKDKMSLIITSFDYIFKMFLNIAKGKTFNITK